MPCLVLHRLAPAFSLVALLLPSDFVFAQVPDALYFAPPVPYDTGRGPSSLSIADFNGDGVPDIATADRFESSVTVLLGRGDGTVHGGRRFATGTEPVSIHHADFNGDGHLDLLTADLADDSISVLPGRGDGTFGDRNRWPVGGEPTSAVPADLNGDGLTDIVTTNGLTDNITVLLGLGDGTFRGGRRFATGENPTSLGVGDLNGDTVPDVFTTDYDSDSVSVLDGLGDGTFHRPRHYTTATGPASVTAGDWDLDGATDLAIVNTSFVEGAISVFLGNNDGTLRGGAPMAAGDPAGRIVTADLNRDGVPDLVTSRSDLSKNVVSILIGRGDGTFKTPIDFPAGNLPLSVAIADLNLDGLPDLVTANYFGNDVSILLAVTQHGTGDGGNGGGGNGPGGNPGDETAIASRLLDAFFEADQSGDARLTFAEAVAVEPALSRELFDTLDLNDDGFLRANELEDATAPNARAGCVPATANWRSALLDVLTLSLAHAIPYLPLP